MTPVIERQATLDAILRTEFALFLRKVFATVSPGDDLHWNWHLGAFAWQLDRVRVPSSRDHAMVLADDPLRRATEMFGAKIGKSNDH